jgi:outer membrane protein assembly factor BamC
MRRGPRDGPRPLEIVQVTRSFRARATRPALLALGLAACLLAGCSSIENVLAGDKIDYRTSGNQRTTGLEVPPDLTQLAKDTRYQTPSGTISASTFQTAAAAPAPAPTVPTVAVQAVGDMRIERLGNERWLTTSLPPEQAYPQVRAFWRDNGFVLVQDRAEAGVMETDWAENRAKLPNDIIRNTIGKVFDGAWSTGELDKFRTRIERNASGGSDIYVTHRGMAEIYVGQNAEATTWQARPADPQLEGEMLARIMIKLGAKEEVARTAVAAAPSTPARARVLEGQPAATLQVDDAFDRAWRRVGLALDRSGFTVEDRDRTQGIYYVRYVDPKFAGKAEPSFMSKIFSFGKKSDDTASLERYRVTVKGEGEKSLVSVLDSKGAPEKGETGQRIVNLLAQDLK